MLKIKYYPSLKSFKNNQATSKFVCSTNIIPTCPKYIWVPMNIPNWFLFYIPLVFPMQSIADIYWGHFSMQIPNSNSHHSLLKCSSQRHHSLGHRCWKTCGRTSSPTPLVQIISPMAETHGCLAVNYTFNGRCKNQRWEHVLSLTWIHANQKHLVTNW